MESSNYLKKTTTFIKSCERACKGIAYSLKTERHLRFHFFASSLVIATGLYLKLKSSEWLFIIVAIGSVLVAELFNTALERAVDLSKPGFHPIAGIAKDIASGAVLVAAIQAVIIGIIVFFPYVF